MYLARESCTLVGVRTGETWRLGHRPALDGLRGVAVLLVVATHVGAFLVPASAPAWLRFPAAGLGVDLFFVLSGFLITSLLLEEHRDGGRIRVGGFYLRRARRLLPAAFTTLGAWCLFRLLVDHVPARELGRTVLVVLTYATDYYKGGHRDVTLGLGHFWTLAVEEKFYLVWPLVLILLLRRRAPLHWLALGAVATSVVVAAHRAWALHAGPVTDATMRTDLRCDGLLLGVALALAWKAGIVRPVTLGRYGVPALVAFVALALVAPARVVSTPAVGVLIVSAVVLVAVVVAGVLDDGAAVARLLSGRRLQHVGRISYSLYLWHVPAIVLVWEHIAASPAARIVLAVGLSFALAETSYRFVEQPFRTHRTQAEKTSMIAGMSSLLRTPA
jgi:peptidoglycan/LPS O-acetylase OafA/YrhL